MKPDCLTSVTLLLPRAADNPALGCPVSEYWVNKMCFGVLRVGCEYASWFSWPSRFYNEVMSQMRVGNCIPHPSNVNSAESLITATGYRPSLSTPNPISIYISFLGSRRCSLMVTLCSNICVRQRDFYFA